MKTLGISIYLGHGTVEKYKDYLQKAAKYGFTRVFTCLISLEKNLEDRIKEFSEIMNYAKSLGMEVIADVDANIFKKLKLDYKNIEFFYNLGLSGIRLDLGFTGNEEAIMSFNPYNLKIELNMSNGTKYPDNIMSYCPNKENIIGCHNFYPHRYSGLSRKHFIKCSEQFKNLGVKTAAFISSNTSNIGPWQVFEGLCTLEEHRNLPIDVQAKDLFNTGLIDEVIIAQCFAHENELEMLSKINRNMLEFSVVLEDRIPEIQRKVVLEEEHFNRGDVSEYMIRSTQSRVKYKGVEFEEFNKVPIKRGDILIESSLYDRYAGELQIALKYMDNSGKTNVVGRIREEEIYLIDIVEPWQKFKFNLKKVF